MSPLSLTTAAEPRQSRPEPRTGRTREALQMEGAQKDKECPHLGGLGTRVWATEAKPWGRNDGHTVLAFGGPR